MNQAVDRNQFVWSAIWEKVAFVPLRLCNALVVETFRLFCKFASGTIFHSNPFYFGRHFARLRMGRGFARLRFGSDTASLSIFDPQWSPKSVIPPGQNDMTAMA